MIVRTTIATSALLALALVALLLSNANTTTAQGPIPTPTPTKAESDLAERCASAYVLILEAEVSVPGSSQSRTVTLTWWDDIAHYLEEPSEVSYRIERRDADPDGSGWQTLTTVTDANTWTGDVELGNWLYRVAIVEIQTNGASRRCEPNWAEVSANVLTDAELIQTELEHYCEQANIYLNLYASVAEPTNWPDETLTLRWGNPLQRHDETDHYVKSEAIHYRIERTPAPAGFERTPAPVVMERTPSPVDADAVWETVADVIDETTWTGYAEPGIWVYRVGVVGVQGSGIVAECETYWAFAEVRILTEVERIKQVAQRQILIEESIHCAAKNLTSNLRSAARGVVREYVKERIGEVVAEIDNYGDETSNFRKLVSLTILLCSDETPNLYGFNLGMSWAMLLLFDGYRDWIY